MSYLKLSCLVGTYIAKTSLLPMWEKSSRVEKRPFLVKVVRSFGTTSPMKFSPRLILSTFSRWMSKPNTRKPGLAFSTARGKPTYLSPMTPTFADFEVILSYNVVINFLSPSNLVSPIWGQTLNLEFLTLPSLTLVAAPQFYRLFELQGGFVLFKLVFVQG